MLQWKERFRNLAASPDLTTEIVGRQRHGGSGYSIYAFSSDIPGQPVCCLAAGVHGDEPEGIKAALILLE